MKTVTKYRKVSIDILQGIVRIIIALSLLEKATAG